MKRLILLLALLPACGDPFVAGIRDPDAGRERGTELGPPDVAHPRETSRDFDAGTDSEEFDAVWTDSSSPPGDAGKDVTTHPPIDAPSDVSSLDRDAGPPPPPPKDAGPTDAGCTPFSPATIMCGGVVMNEPENYCVSYGGGGYITPTPAECQCAATYTCACLEAHGICPMGTLVTCEGPGFVECS
jgi:hypothetical protein